MIINGINLVQGNIRS